MRQAAVILAEQDPVLARLVDVFGLPRLSKPTESHYAALVRAITQQQLAAPAAAAIHRRLVDVLGGEVTPEQTLATGVQVLRSAGLSASKTASLLDLAQKVADDRVVLQPRRLARQGDEEVIAHLTTVRGIGEWSAQMFLLFQLHRLDVWPVGDLALRKGYAHAWGIGTPTPAQLRPLGDPYHPYRSVLAWYCWHAARRTPDMSVLD
ncbi:DNA-3-methyladenine glycosylase family protein [Streptomyces sp. NPDC059215]|uniref:DNA-3-methyladenine glycosylase family protein n=1 Tax=Streptomyces sp. NPDC059215 TaxID=3346772 RepID=UPI00367F1BFF